MEKNDLPSLEALWQEIIKGDKSALGALFDALSRELITYAYKISLDKSLAKDAVQDVFVDIWQYRNNLTEDVQVRFYLYRSLRRTVVRLMKEELSTGENLNDAYSFDAEISPETAFCNLETENHQQVQIQESLKALSEREREIITLKYYSNLKIREIAELLDLKEQTVANTLQNALGKLRKKLSIMIVLLVWIIFI